ncbi:PREDICTED: tumor necrosis factor receptor superfamily member 27-like, partial [Gekko japonicus]|uniref:Tumor necrosis factor receptor superfamily member 27-like n=1 Tax=Gekko japonicus TaxID=146911 RepID=A0ABM1L3S6_GEKJA
MAGAALLLLLMLATEAPHPFANPVECQASEYLDEHGKCAPCRECGPGLQLSKECGYGEGGDSQCAPCHPRRFKDSWGHHGCKPCLSCSLINRIQQSPCTATSDAACGECFPGFYSKTQIGGLQDLECIPCTKQTPPSEPQCRSRVSPEKVENPAGATLDTALAVLTSSALVIIVLVSVLSLLCCQRFWKSQCQRVLLQRQDFSGQRGMSQASAGPARFSHHERLPDPCCLSAKSVTPRHGSLEGPAEAVRFFSGGEGLRVHLPTQQADWDFSKRITASPKAPQARSPLDTRPLLRDSRCSNGSAGGSSFTELRQDSARDPDDPAPLSSCATEMQHPWPHSPVECTELDLQDFSTRAGLLHRDAAERTLRGRTELAPA